MDAAANLHFKAISHPAGYIEAPPCGQLDMTFQADPCEMTAKLILQTPEGPRKVDRHVLFGQRSTGEIAMNVKFPEAGMWTVIQTEKWLIMLLQWPKMYSTMVCLRIMFERFLEIPT